MNFIFVKVEIKVLSFQQIDQQKVLAKTLVAELNIRHGKEKKQDFYLDSLQNCMFLHRAVTWLFFLIVVCCIKPENHHNFGTNIIFSYFLHLLNVF